MKYILTIDNGGTLTKSVLYDIEGKAVSHSKEYISVINDVPTFIERDMNNVWDSNVKVIKYTIDKAKVDPGDIICVTISGHGKGLYLVGEDDKFIMNSILSTDTRASKYCDEWKENGIEDKLKNIIHQDLISCQIPALLNWIKDNKKDIISKIKYIFGIKDFIRYMLTGEAYGEITDFSGSAIIDLNTKEYSDESFRLLNIEEFKKYFPPLIKSSDIAGYITDEVANTTGLKSGTPVIGGLFDIDACALAMGLLDDESLAVIGGTWSINEFVQSKPSKFSTKNSIYFLDDKYLVEESSPTSASNFEWVINNLFDKDKEICGLNYANKYEYFNYMVKNSKLKEKGPLFFPFIYGSNYNQKSKATLIGVDASISKADVVRSIYEGIGYCHKVHLEKLYESKSSFKTIKLAGGIAKSDVWVQILADIFNKPIEIIDQDELGTYGAFILACIALEIYKDYKTACEKLIKVKKYVYPINKNVMVYNEKFKKYKQIEKELEKVWQYFS